MSHEILWTSAPTSWVLLFVWDGMRTGRAPLPTSQPMAQAGVPLLIRGLQAAALYGFHNGKKHNYYKALLSPVIFNKISLALRKPCEEGVGMKIHECRVRDIGQSALLAVITPRILFLGQEWVIWGYGASLCDLPGSPKCPPVTTGDEGRLW